LYIALGILIGGGLAALRILKLEREKAELKARAETIEAARAQMGDQFKLTAQEAVRNAHESFLQLAQEKLLAAQKDGSHDLEKRQKAIEEMVKPVHKQLEGLGKALEQSGGLQKAIREDL